MSGRQFLALLIGSLIFATAAASVMKPDMPVQGFQR